MSLLNHPLVSVVIPTYNNRGLLTQSIDSVLCQDYQNFEVIVVDDNDPETDARKATELLMSKYESNSKVLYIKHERNKNGAAARNTGIRNAKGDYIAFLDDDDSFLQGKLTKQMNYLDTHKEYAAVYCLAKIGDYNEPTTPYEGDVLIPLLMNKSKMFTPTLVFRKDALLSIGGFDESFRRHQDYELLIKFFEKGYLIGCLRERLVVIHPVGGNHLTPAQHEEMKKRYLETFGKTLDRIELRYPGCKNKIIVNNYASVFVSDVAGGHLKCAFRIFHRYFWKSPSAF